jgi:hypothetical protein
MPPPPRNAAAVPLRPASEIDDLEELAPPSDGAQSRPTTGQRRQPSSRDEAQHAASGTDTQVSASPAQSRPPTGRRAQAATLTLDRKHEHKGHSAPPEYKRLGKRESSSRRVASPPAQPAAAGAQSAIKLPMFDSDEDSDLEHGGTTEAAHQHAGTAVDTFRAMGSSAIAASSEDSFSERHAGDSLSSAADALVARGTQHSQRHVESTRGRAPPTPLFPLHSPTPEVSAAATPADPAAGIETPQRAADDRGTEVPAAHLVTTPPVQAQPSLVSAYGTSPLLELPAPRTARHAHSGDAASSSSSDDDFSGAGYQPSFTAPAAVRMHPTPVPARPAPQPVRPGRGTLDLQSVALSPSERQTFLCEIAACWQLQAVMSQACCRSPEDERKGQRAAPPPLAARALTLASA